MHVCGHTKMAGAVMIRRCFNDEVVAIATWAGPDGGQQVPRGAAGAASSRHDARHSRLCRYSGAPCSSAALIYPILPTPSPNMTTDAVPATNSTPSQSKNVPSRPRRRWNTYSLRRGMDAELSKTRAARIQL